MTTTMPYSDCAVLLDGLSISNTLLVTLLLLNAKQFQLEYI